MASRTVYDAIVVGSGATGGWAAKELTERGLHVLCLEAGHSEQVTKLKWKWSRLRQKLGYRHTEDPKARARQPIQSQCYAWGVHPAGFISDAEHPYTTPPDKPFAWIRSRQVGGRLQVRGHGLHFYRLSDMDLHAASRDGFGEDWPLDYAELRPYYEKVERLMSMRGNADGIEHLPESLFVGPVQPSPGERRLDEAVRKQFPGRKVISRRTAQPPPTLDAARRTGKLTLKTGAIVREVQVDANTGNASGVAWVDRHTGRTHEARGRVVVLAASAIESARLLLNSKSRQHPEGLGNSSGLVGCYLMDHTYLFGIESRMPLPKADQWDFPSWGYVPQFRNVKDKDGRFLRGYGVNVYVQWDQCHVVPFGEMLPRKENRVTIAPGLTDKWGIPAVHISCGHSENELAMAKDQHETAKEMLLAAGFEITKEKSQLSVPGTAIHEVGTARMGKDPKTSVLNRFNQSWDVKNLFVMDGSCFVSQGVQNPTLTMMALTVRACEHLAEQLRRGEL